MNISITNHKKIKYPKGSIIKPRNNTCRHVRKHNKFNQHVFYSGGVKYDSKLEYNYAVYLLRKHINFVYHPEPIRIVSKYMNGTKKHQGNRYTPDFAIVKNGKIIEYIDTKVNATRTTATQLRMSVFCSISDIPLYIASYDKNTGIYTKELF